MTEPVGRPAYQEVADDLRRRIAVGEFPVGSAIPSTARLTKAYRVSSTVVRAAINQLRMAGLVTGQPGKGVFVRSTPEATAQQAASIDDLAKQIEELQAELVRIKTAQREEISASLAALRRHVRLIQTHLIGLYAQLGKPVPDDLTAMTHAASADVAIGEPSAPSR